MSRFDQVYRRLLISKFFTKGWGKPENLKRLFDFRQVIANRDTCQKLVPVDYKVYIDKEYVQGDVRTLEGHFVSPFTLCLPGVMPKEVEVAKFQVILPVKWKTTLRPVCLHLAGTGDHYFWRRRTLIAKPLLKEYGIGSIILENPYYGARKPRKQVRSSLHNVSDLFVMGGALVLESLALFHWCERQGFGPLAITGVSMGGHMASAAATNWHKPLSLVACLSWSTASCTFTQMASLAAVNWPRPVSLVPCLSWSTASIVFAQGVLRGAVPWGLLQSQYLEDSVYQNELRGLMHSPEQDEQHAYILGQQFVQDYNAGQHHRAVARQQVMKEPTDLSSEDVYFEQVSTNGRSRGDHDDSRYSNNGRSMLVGLARHFYEHRSHGRSSLEGEVLEFMRGVMDEFTHLSNFSMPVDTSLITIVTARHDAYMPRDSVRSLEEIWPGAEVRYIDTGHIAAFLLKQDVFRKAIYDSICRQTEKYYS